MKIEKMMAELEPVSAQAIIVLVNSAPELIALVKAAREAAKDWPVINSDILEAIAALNKHECWREE